MKRRPLGLVLALALTFASSYGTPAKVASDATVTAAACVQSIGATMPAPTSMPPIRVGLHAAWWGQSGFLTLCPGERATLRVSYRNVGTEPWNGALLGTWLPAPGQDKASPLGGDGTNGTASLGWPRFDRLARQSPAAVVPGEVATFEFAIQAPTTPGGYTLGVRPLIEGVTWLEDFGVHWRITVPSPDGTLPCKGSVAPEANAASFPRGLAGLHAAWAGQSGYATLCPGERVTLRVKYANSGHLGWPAGQVRLGTWGPEPGQDRSSLLGGTATGWLTPTRVSANAVAVAPGEIATFEVTIQAPMTPGRYALGVRPVAEGIAWLEDYGVFWHVTVLDFDGTPPPLVCGWCWPLTGEPLSGGPVSRRPLLVKIDNAPAARPHYGLSDADMVWETLVEGFITRLGAVFHSKDPAVLGSVRSGRLIDRYLAPSLRGALAYSGAGNEELALFRQDVGEGRYVDIGTATGAGNAYYRVGFRANPHNLFTSSAALRGALGRMGQDVAVEVPRYDFAPPLAEWPAASTGLTASVPASTIAVPYRSGVEVRYQYDAASRAYARWQAGAREIDAANGKPIAARNVVVIGTEVTARGTDNFGSPKYDMRTTGTGPCSVFRSGRRQDCTWSRASLNDAFTFTNFSGEKILLSPGQTWFHVVPKEWVISSAP